MRIRLHGTEAEVQATADHLAVVLEVLDISRPSPGRPPSRLGPLYLTLTAPATDTITKSETATGA
ncbi:MULTISPECIES: hypothetical protein [Streptomyces]|uniref:hypothetical protein n=1 Tax=Streptomyces TaxID=1883 RepID=UPI00292DD9A3|nr:hypothetical protein [Streptomyces sp. NEAU-HV9]